MPTSDHPVNADDYLNSIKPGLRTSALRAFHPDILKLRAAGCTLAQIAEFLRINGLTTTLSSVGKYLQKHAQVSSPPAAPQPRSAAAKRPEPPVAPDRSEPPGFKSAEQLRAENPTLPRIQINKLYAQQYDRPVLSPQEIEEFKRKYPPPPTKHSSR
jgi:hypothetical protein